MSSSQSIEAPYNPRKRVRLAVTLGAALALLGTAILGLDLPSSLAQGGFLEELFGGDGGYARYVVAPLRYNSRGYSYARHVRRQARHQGSYRLARAARYKARYAQTRRRVPIKPVAAAVTRTAALATAPIASTQYSRRSVCVRACDGFFFPIANLSRSSDIANHQAACGNICPGAETRLYMLPSGSDKIEDAVAARGGERYTALLSRVGGSGDKSKTCSCHSAAGAPVESNAFLNDLTLRPGDTVVTPQGMRVVRGGSHYPFKKTDFLSLAETRDMPKATRGALAAIEHAMKTPHGRHALMGDRKPERRVHKRELRSDGALDAGATPVVKPN
jgi:hypothetical protein